MSSSVVEQAAVSADAAASLVAAAVEAAKAESRAMVIAVVDNGGILKAFQRMDGAPLLSVQIAQDKAYTAAGFGMATHEWHEFIKNDPPLADGIVHTPRLVVFGGGYPLYHEGRLVGGLGLSGGHYADDMRIAEAALAATGFGQ